MLYARSSLLRRCMSTNEQDDGCLIQSQIMHPHRRHSYITDYNSLLASVHGHSKWELLLAISTTEWKWLQVDDSS